MLLEEAKLLYNYAAAAFVVSGTNSYTH